MTADPARSASQARPKASITARIVVVPGRSIRLASLTRRGTTKLPTTSVATRNPKATAVIRATPRSVTSSPRVSPGDHGQDDQPDDVVDDGRPEDDLALGLLQAAEVGEDAGGDADARRRQGRPRDDGDEVREAEETAGPVAQGERQDDADGGHGRRGPADLQELPQVGLQADGEEQQDDPELGEEVDHLDLGIDEPQDRGAEQHAGDELAEDGRLADGLGQGPAELRRAEHDDEEAQELGDGEMVHAARYPSVKSTRGTLGCLGSKGNLERVSLRCRRRTAEGIEGNCSEMDERGGTARATNRRRW